MTLRVDLSGRPTWANRHPRKAMLFLELHRHTSWLPLSKAFLCGSWDFVLKWHVTSPPFSAEKKVARWSVEKWPHSTNCYDKQTFLFPSCTFPSAAWLFVVLEILQAFPQTGLWRGVRGGAELAKQWGSGEDHDYDSWRVQVNEERKSKKKKIHILCGCWSALIWG